jgi:hypothetical protein
MKKNIGSIEKIIRLVAAAIVIALYFTNIIPGTLGIVLLAVSGILVLTSFISFCPLWAIFKVNTGAKE